MDTQYLLESNEKKMNTLSHSGLLQEIEWMNFKSKVHTPFQRLGDQNDIPVPGLRCFALEESEDRY